MSHGADMHAMKPLLALLLALGWLFAATPVRAISFRPSGRIRSAKLSIFSGVPVISKTKLSSVLSTTCARKKPGS